MMDKCLFCKIVLGELEAKIIYETDLVIGFLDLFPVSDGHCLLIPKKHFENFSSTPQPYLTAIVEAKKVLANKILDSSLKPGGMNYLSNETELAGQSVMHYHEHIIPKYNVDEGFNLTSLTVKKTNKTLDEVYNILKR